MKVSTIVVTSLCIIAGLAMLLIATHLMTLVPPDFKYDRTPQLMDSVRYNWGMILYILGGIMTLLGVITSAVVTIVGDADD